MANDLKRRPGDLLKESSAKTNHTKLSRLLIVCGTNVMRRVLDYLLLPSDLEIKLTKKTVRRRLERLKRKRLLTQPQWEDLFPSSRRRRKSLDITLLFTLLRELSRLSAPPKGWNALPDEMDLSLSADLARIKYYRNKFSHDKDGMEVEDDHFKDLGNRIKNCLLRMLHFIGDTSITEWEIAIHDLLNGFDVGKQLKKSLKHHYASGERPLLLPFPWMEGKQFHIENLYSSTNMLERGTTKMIEMENLFSPSSGRLAGCRRIMIQGEPGVGKSSFCKKLAYDWSKEKLPKFDLVLVLRCGKFNGEDIWSAIEEQILPEELSSKKEEIQIYIQEHQEKLLMVFDGLDEMPVASGAKIRKTVLDIISGKILPQCHLIVTSRTDTEVPEIRNHFDKIVNMQGFQWKDSCSFFKRFFSLSPDKTEEIISVVSKNPELKELARNPLYAAFICLIEENREQDKFDLWSFFHEIVFCVAERFSVEKRGEQVSDDTLVDGFHDEHLMLGKLAFEMSKENGNFFEERQLPYYLAQTLRDMGFLSCKKLVNKIRPKSLCYFSSPLMKKYFAALYERRCSSHQ